jgi:hypothetical protein
MTGEAGFSASCWQVPFRTQNGRGVGPSRGLSERRSSRLSSRMSGRFGRFFDGQELIRLDVVNFLVDSARPVDDELVHFGVMYW